MNYKVKVFHYLWSSCFGNQMGVSFTYYILLGIVFLDMVATGLVVPTIPYFAQRLHLGPSIQGTIMSLYGVLQLIGSPILGRMSDKYGRKPILLISILGTLASYYLMIFADTIFLLFLSRAIVGLAKNTETSCYAMITDIFSEKHRLKRLGYVGSVVGLGFVIGPVLSGLLTLSHNLETPVYLSCSILLVTSFSALLLLPETKNFELKSVNELHVPANVDSSSESSLHKSNNDIPISNNSGTYTETNSIKVADDRNGMFYSNGSPLLSPVSSSLEDDLNDNEFTTVNIEFVPRPSPETSVPRIHSASRRPRQTEGSAGRSTPVDQTLVSNGHILDTVRPKGGPLSILVGTDSVIYRLFNSVFTPSPIQPLLMIFVATTTGMFVYFGSISILLQMLGIPVQVSSWITAWNGGITVLSSFIIHILADRYTTHDLMFKSLIVLALSLILTSLVFLQENVSIIAIISSQIPLLLSARTLKNTLMTMITSRSNTKNTGALMGMLNSLESLCRSFTPFVGGILMQVTPLGPSLVAGFLNLFVYFYFVNSSMIKSID